MQKVTALLTSAFLARCGDGLTHPADLDRSGRLIRTEAPLEVNALAEVDGPKIAALKLRTRAKGSVERRPSFAVPRSPQSSELSEVASSGSARGVASPSDSGAPPLPHDTAPPEKCTDLTINCLIYQKNCNAEDHNGHFARTRCKATCGLCDVDKIEAAEHAADRYTIAENCTDEAPNCESWTDFCADVGKNGDYAKQNCKATCGMCDCVDTAGNCEEWTDFCEEEGENGNYARDSCRGTCGLCGGSTSNSSTGCSDMVPCHEWADQCNHQFAKQNCRETCGLCPGRNMTSCRDTAPNCNAWSNHCTWDYAQKNCKETCNVCAGGGPPEVELTECKDISEDCTKLTILCDQDDSNGQFAKDNCKATCGLCGDSVPEEVEGGDVAGGECKDTSSDCSSLASLCEHDDENGKEAKDKCRLTCGLCEEESIGENASASEADAEDECQDDAHNCHTWKPYCYDEDDNGAYAKKHCRETCGLCVPGTVPGQTGPGEDSPGTSGDVIEECKDIAKNCDTWEPYCNDVDDNGVYAKKECKSTCGLCPQGGSNVTAGPS